MTAEHWSATADRVCSGSLFLLGEDEDGRWCVRQLRGDWYRQVGRWHPLYWLAYLGSRLTRRLVWLERP
ncbi:hypothetical protein [Nocardia brasiliensis]|uniref:hypothetical protein n=1 Tax=Nocardia brasiliensis TaxID=37326 RepID=UPI0024588299|nr:hypothetical protein [Nocardia brasiliensis]